MSSRLTKDALKEVWEAGGAGREALAEELQARSPALSTINYDVEGDVITNLRSFWNCKIHDATTGEAILQVDPRDYWSMKGLYCPAGYKYLSPVSKRGYSYGELIAKLVVPDLSTIPVYADGHVGFRLGPDIIAGSASFTWKNDGPGHTMRLLAYARNFGKEYGVDITSLAPADFLTKEHHYTVKVNRNNTEFYIDGVLKALLIGSPGASNFYLAGPPYAIRVHPNPPPRVMHAFVENNPNGYDFTLDLTPLEVGFGNGDPCPPRVYRLYQTGTSNLLTSVSLSSGTITSHPFPLFGYQGKTVYFMADQNGDFDIEILTQTGNWRIYSPDAGGHTNSNYTANTLEVYTIAAEALLGRVVFTPDAYPCTFSEAEVVLG